MFLLIFFIFGASKYNAVPNGVTAQLICAFVFAFAKTKFLMTGLGSSTICITKQAFVFLAIFIVLV